MLSVADKNSGQTQFSHYFGSCGSNEKSVTVEVYFAAAAAAVIYIVQLNDV